MLKLEKVKLHLGARRPLKILHVTDAHLSLADDSDGEDMKKHAAGRRELFMREAGFPERDPIGYLEEALAMEAVTDGVVVTGDVLDFTSHANMETARGIFAGHHPMFCAGNHEFCPKVGIPDSFERRNDIYEKINGIFGGNMYFDSRVVGGINLIAVDNSYFVWDEKQRELFEAEFAKGLPCLIFAHTPILDSCLAHNPSHRDLKPCDGDIDRTRRITAWLIGHPLVKGFFTGHYHVSMTQALDGGKTCRVTAGLFKGEGTLIEID